MVKERISQSQLFALIIFFQIGSTTLFALGIEAKQDAWIAVFIALLAGIVLVWIFTEIQKHFPHQNLAEILISVLGKWIASPLIILYALSFFWTASFNLYEFSEFMVSTFFFETPISAILFLGLLLMIYSLFLGVEVIARSGEIIFPWFLGFIIIMFLLTGISGIIKPNQLLPIMENGVMPVLKASTQVITFPFGEMVIFLMYWCYVNNQQVIRKTSIWAVIIAGIILILSLILMITVLGAQLASNESISLFKVFQKINVGNFIQRLDAIGGAILFIGGFYKGLLYLYGSRMLIQTLFNIKAKHQKWLITFLVICLFCYILLYFKDVDFYRWVGLQINNKYVYPLFQITIPIFLLVIIKLKTKGKGIKKIQRM
ncbi:spore germination protein KB [Ammoniphilus resinae]|uniref:Spore germination protein KB n=1 Tax=Ammoniphilus resinae TaxID=861532 RepID=A0ABS4GWU1_9BACL|nr:GerAB/ArcD/ProY family transporter [Ammoniphilus resinae]MBP1934741.1 spore germination protein KB [Ammoniphilus resinae]